MPRYCESLPHMAQPSVALSLDNRGRTGPHFIYDCRYFLAWYLLTMASVASGYLAHVVSCCAAFLSSTNEPAINTRSLIRKELAPPMAGKPPAEASQPPGVVRSRLAVVR